MATGDIVAFVGVKRKLRLVSGIEHILTNLQSAADVKVRSSEIDKTDLARDAASVIELTKSNISVVWQMILTV